MGLLKCVETLDSVSNYYISEMWDLQLTNQIALFVTTIVLTRNIGLLLYRKNAIHGALLW